MSTGKFVCIEGLEGVGKSTNLAFITDWLFRNNIAHVVTREPGGTPIAEEVRGLLLSKRPEPVDAMCELLLVFAARAQHLNTKIRPSLEDGLWVVTDRFTDSTFAYQGAGRGMPLEQIAQLEALVQQGLKPDLTILLDAPAEVGLQRATARGELDRFESERLSFFTRARDVYLDRAAASPDRYLVIDATQSLEAVQREIAAGLERLT
ncbi:dTMP kinase [Salinispirillum sp. LH 10-3-1]|uniref:Thymidylate kinase n=1 Tax=Salinispirillum sp. LH 10-3-1 TaxID=2952525 RepID=A0AB38YC79_9GAMM